MKWFSISVLSAAGLAAATDVPLITRDPVTADPSFSWDLQPLDPHKLYIWPPGHQGFSTLQFPKDDDWGALAFTAMETFQTLFANGLEPMKPRTCHTKTKDLAWTQGQYVFYGAIHILSSYPQNAQISFQNRAGDAKTTQLSLVDAIQYHIAINHWDAGFAILRRAKDNKKYGYANFKIAELTDDEAAAKPDESIALVSLPSIPPLEALPASISKTEWIMMNLTARVDGPCHVVEHRNDKPDSY